MDKNDLQVLADTFADALFARRSGNPAAAGKLRALADEAAQDFKLAAANVSADVNCALVVWKSLVDDARETMSSVREAAWEHRDAQRAVAGAAKSARRDALAAAALQGLLASGRSQGAAAIAVQWADDVLSELERGQ